MRDLQERLALAALFFLFLGTRLIVDDDDDTVGAECELITQQFAKLAKYSRITRLVIGN